MSQDVHYFWVGVEVEVERFGRFFSIRKSYFWQVKSLILVGTLPKISVFNPYYLKSLLNLWGWLRLSTIETYNRFRILLYRIHVNLIALQTLRQVFRAN